MRSLISNPSVAARYCNSQTISDTFMEITVSMLQKCTNEVIKPFACIYFPGGTVLPFFVCFSFDAAVLDR